MILIGRRIFGIFLQLDTCEMSFVHILVNIDGIAHTGILQEVEMSNFN